LPNRRRGVTEWGRETALLAADRGAHVVVADKDVAAAQAVAAEVQKIGGKEAAIAVAIDIRNRESILQALRETVSTYGGLDIVVNTAAVFSLRRRMAKSPIPSGG